MWMIWIVVATASLLGLYTNRSQVQHPSSLQLQAVDLAVNMATYRAAVVDYAKHTYPVYPISPGGVTQAALAPYLPYWYPSSATLIWGNYIDSDGTILIYAISTPAQVYTAELVTLSQNSMLVGTASASGTLVSPIFGDTGIVLPKPGGALIGSGRPVWLAHGA